MKPHDKWPGVSIIVNKSRRAQDGPQQTLTDERPVRVDVAAELPQHARKFRGAGGSDDPVSASSSAARFASIRALRSISARLRRGFGLVHRASRGRLPEPRRARASPLGGSPRSTSTPSKRQSAPAKSLPGAEPWGSMALMAISAQPLEKVNFGGNGAATPVRGWMIQTPEVGVPNVLEQAASLMHLARRPIPCLFGADNSRLPSCLTLGRDVEARPGFARSAFEASPRRLRSSANATAGQDT